MLYLNSEAMKHLRCRESCIKLNALKQKSIMAHFSDAIALQQKQNREMLQKVLKMKYLLRQGLPIRGRYEEEGNLMQLLKCRSEDVKSLKSFLAAKKCLSHDIIDKQ